MKIIKRNGTAVHVIGKRRGREITHFRTRYGERRYHNCLGGLGNSQRFLMMWKKRRTEYEG